MSYVYVNALNLIFVPTGVYLVEFYTKMEKNKLEQGWYISLALSCYAAM